MDTSPLPIPALSLAPPLAEGAGGAGESRLLLEEAYFDPAFFCRFFLPHLFSSEIQWFHLGIMAILTRRCAFLEMYPAALEKLERNFLVSENWEDEKARLRPIFWRREGRLEMSVGQFTLLMIPRGFAKTTIAGVAIPLWEILFQEVPFFVYISEAAPHAKMQLANVKRELESNERIKALFGELKPAMRDPEKWSESFFETTTGVAMAARGRGGQVRGLLHRGNRPTKIIIDDVEDKESVSTDEQRHKTRVWFKGDVEPALPRMSNDATITALGTLLHRDALLATLCRDPRWTVVRLGALDADGAPLWPENMDHDKLAKTKASYALAGLLDVFYMEYFNKPVAAETQLFPPSCFKWSAPDRISHTAIYVDPAISESRRADSTVIIVVGMNERGQIWVLDGWGRAGATPRETVDEYFRLSRLHRCVQHGVESVAWQRALVHLLQEEMFRKGYYFEVMPVTHGRVDKQERIRGVLAARYRAGYITHARHFPELEMQLQDFPGGTHDDWPDALAGAIALLDPYAAAAAGDVDLGQDEYRPLEVELGGEWRAM